MMIIDRLFSVIVLMALTSNINNFAKRENIQVNILFFVSLFPVAEDVKLKNFSQRLDQYCVPG